MPADRRPGTRQVLGRAVLFGVCWGAFAGSGEAVWHLSRWSLYTSAGDAAWFLARSVLYAVGFFGGWTAAVVGACLLPPLRRRFAGDPGTRGDPLVVGAIAAGTVVLYGVVTWRVGYHINDPWSAPALWGGILGIWASAAVVGAVAAMLATPLVRRYPWLWLGPLPPTLLLALSIPLTLGGSAESASPQRVLLITLDTFRADRLGAAGGAVTTPHLDELAARGVLFEQAVAQAPITCPAHLALLSATSPTTNGVFANGTRIPDDLPLLQESFQAAGIPTAAFVAGYPVTSRFGFDRGFDVFDDDFSPAFGDHRLTVRRLVDQFLYTRGAARERDADQVLARVRPWFEAHAAGGFFCWVHLFDPHGPYAPPAPYIESIAGPMPAPVEGPEMPEYWPPAHKRVADPGYWKKRYDEEIVYTDDRVGRLLAMLAEQGVLDDTLVAVVADHGESLDEHDYYFEHGLHLYDASLRIPMIVAGPEIPAGRRVPCQVRGMDLAPTVLDMVGLEMPESFEGDSLRTRWELGCPADGVALSIAATVEPPWIENPGAELSLRSDGDLRFKYVMHRSSDDELYDLVADPGETDDQLGRHADVEYWMKDQIERAAEGMNGEAPTLSPDVRAQLEALGYIDDGPAPPPPVPPDDDSADEGSTP